MTTYVRLPTPTWNGGSATTGTIAFAANTAANTIIVIAHGGGSAPTGLPTDTAGNVYVQVDTIVNALFGSTMTIWWCKTCATSAGTNTITCSFTGGQDVIIHAIEYPSVSAVSAHGTGQNNGTSGTASLTLTSVGSTDIYVMASYVFSGTSGAGNIGGSAANSLGSALSDISAEDQQLSTGGSVVGTMTGTSSWGHWVGLALTPSGGGAASPPLLQRRYQEEPTSDARRQRTYAVPLAYVAQSPPLWIKPRFEDTFPLNERATRVKPLVAVYVPNVAPFTVKRDLEEAVIELRARRVFLVPATPLATTVSVARKAAELPADEERATRRATIPAPQTSDAAPLRIRVACQDTSTDEAAFRPRAALLLVTTDAAPTRNRVARQVPDVDESANRIKAFPLPVNADNAPLPSRRALEQTATDEVAQRVRPLPSASVDFAPIRLRSVVETAAVDEFARRALTLPTVPAIAGAPAPRRAAQEAIPDEVANRIKAVPPPVNADTSPLQNRRAGEQTVPDEVAQRTRPTVAPSVDFAPLPSRRAIEQAVPDEVASRFRQQPAASVDFAPLLGRKPAEQTIPDESARRYQQPAPSTDLAPLTNRRTNEDASLWERLVARIFPPQSAPFAGPSLAQRRAASTDESPDEVARRARAVPPPGTVDNVPLTNRRAAEQTVVDESAFRPLHPVPVSSAAPGPPPLTIHRAAEETIPDERATRWKGFPSPVTADIAPARNRRSNEETATDETAQRAKLPQAQVTAFSPLQVRRPTEETAASESAKRSPQFPAPSVDFAPLPSRRAVEQTTTDETARRYQRPSASTDFAPLQSRRARDEATADEAAKRPQLPPAQPVAVAPVIGRRTREDGAQADEYGFRCRPVPISPPAAAPPPLRGRRAIEEVGLLEFVWRRIQWVFGVAAPPPSAPGCAHGTVTLLGSAVGSIALSAQASGAISTTASAIGSVAPAAQATGTVLPTASASGNVTGCT